MKYIFACACGLSTLTAVEWKSSFILPAVIAGFATLDAIMRTTRGAPNG